MNNSNPCLIIIDSKQRSIQSKNHGAISHQHFHTKMRLSLILCSTLIGVVRGDTSKVDKKNAWLTGCLNECNGNGVCNSTTMRCACSPGWTSEDCSERICTMNTQCSGHGVCQNDRCHCDFMWTGDDCSERGCPNDCNGDNGVCRSGVCECT